MNTLQKLSTKPWIIISMTLIIGILIGFIGGEIFTRSKYESSLKMKTVEGFKDSYLNLIKPDESQRTEIEQIVEEYARKNTQLIADFSDSIKKLKAEMNSKLSPQLKSEQKARINGSSKPTHTQKTILETKSENVFQDQQAEKSKEEKKIQRQELRKQKVLERIENKIDERSLVLKKELDLNDEQFEKVNKLNVDFTMQFIKIKSDSTLDDINRKMLLRELKKELVFKMKSILSPEQFEKFKELGKEKIKRIKNE